MPGRSDNRQHREREQRQALAERVSELLELPMVLLAFVMLGLFTVEYLVPLSPETAVAFATAQLIIWAIFAFEFVLELYLAADKRAYLRRNWLAAISVALPPLRIARIARLARVLRPARLPRMLALVNRSLRALSFSLGRRGFKYVVAATVIVVLGSAAGVLAFERDAAASALNTPAEAIWWAAATVTTVSPQVDPITLEGRVIAWLLRVYALAVFGYITATIASYFIGQDTRSRQGVGELMARLDTIERQLAQIERHLEARSASGGSAEARLPSETARRSL